MCSGRVDLEFILRAFYNGHDGVFIGGCKLNECNYVTHGNYDALSNTYISKKIMEQIGLDPKRLSIEFMSGGDGILLAKVIDRVTQQIKDIGPLGQAEGMDKQALQVKLLAARKLVPYLKLVERERLRVPERSESAYRDFYASDEMTRLFDDLIGEKLTTSQIISLLETNNKPLSVSDIADKLGLSPSQVSKHMNSSSRQGLVKYDTDSNAYARV